MVLRVGLGIVRQTGTEGTFILLEPCNKAQMSAKIQGPGGGGVPSRVSGGRSKSVSSSGAILTLAAHKQGREHRPA